MARPKAAADAPANLGPEGGRGRAPAKGAAARQGASTLAVHAGEEPDPTSGAVNVPVHLSTTFLYPELPDGAKAPYIYTRYANPSIDAVERKLAALEQATAPATRKAGSGPSNVGSVLFASGMAAIQAICTSALGPGDTVAVQRGVYGGTTAYLRDELARTGVKVVPFDAQEQGKGRGKAARAPKASDVPKGAKLVWMESITNPLLRVADIPAWAEAAHDAGARLAVDATFASPLLQPALQRGADYAMHSATKYLSGHTDVTVGAVTCSTELREGVWMRRRNLGAVPDPHAAYLLGRGMKTLALRMERHCANAHALAVAATEMPGVAAVHYPGLEDHPDHEVARRVLAGGFGGMLTLDLGSLARAQAFRRKVRVMLPASSLGGVESLVSLPLETSHAYATPESRRADGVTDGLVRISVGIEDIADLIEDVRQAVGPGR